MPANQIRAITDSFIDVSIASMEQQEAGSIFNPALDRLSQLAVASGTHYLQLPEYLGSTSMLVTDFEPQVTTGLHLREAVIAKGTETRHYVFDIANARTMMVRSEVPVKPGTMVAAFSPDMPPVLTATAANFSVVNRITGRNYDKRILTRALNLQLVDSPEYAQTFLKDTMPFLDSVWVRTQPKVYAQKQ